MSAHTNFAGELFLSYVSRQPGSLSTPLTTRIPTFRNPRVVPPAPEKQSTATTPTMLPVFFARQ